MKRVIVDYSKLTNEILNLLVEKFPEGYDETDIIRFKNARNETVEAVEVRTEDTIYLVKVSTKLADRIENYDEDELVIPETDPIKDLDIDEDDDEEDTEEEKIISDDSDEEEDNDRNDYADEEADDDDED